MSEKILGAAEDESRFETHDAESHRIWTFEKAPTSYDWTPIGYAGKHLTSLSWSELASPANPPAPASYSSSDSGITGSLHAIFQTSRPEHVSGRPDILPFSDKSTCKQVFSALKLPLAYLMIADGALGISHSHIIRDAFDRPIRFDFIVHCASKQGDWSMALSHSVATRDTSAFLSIELDMDKPPIVDALRTWQDYAFHPAYLPCIMFADMLRKSVKRRFQIKTRIRALEETLRTVTKAAQRAPGPEYENFDRMLEEPQRIETLFDLLHGCRKDQSSREGRYELWSTYYGAIHESLCYAENAIKWVEPEHFRKIHSDLRQWSQLTWRKFESLKARDKDHIARVDNLSAMLYSIVQQRDGRIQANIARASQRDSEDMKFIALLGSIFLPASLVASILNVQEFQFLPGAGLFGVYLAITIPFIGLVVTICLVWPRWKRLRNTVGHRPLS